MSLVSSIYVGCPLAIVWRCINLHIYSRDQDCVKSVQIRSFSGSYFPVFRLNMEIHSVNLRIQSEYRKIRTCKILGKKLWYKPKKSSKIGKDQKIIISAFAQFLHDSQSFFSKTNRIRGWALFYRQRQFRIINK